jgi:hypothetical protein
LSFYYKNHFEILSPERAEYVNAGRSPTKLKRANFKPCKGEINFSHIKYYAPSGLLIRDPLLAEGFALCYNRTPFQG